MADVWVKTFDTAPAVLATLKDANGAAVNIADATVAFSMREIGGTTSVIEGAEASNDQVTDGSDGSKGKVSYPWQEGDTDGAGGYHGEFEVTFQDGEVETFPNDGYITIAILDDLGELAS